MVHRLLEAQEIEEKMVETKVNALPPEDPLFSSAVDALLADKATQLTLIDNITPVATKDLPLALASIRQQVLGRSVALLENKNLSDKDREQKVVYFINQYAEREPRTEHQISRKVALQKELSERITNKTVQISLQDLAERLTLMKKLTSEDPDQKSKLVFSLNQQSSSSGDTTNSSSVKIETTATPKAAQNTTRITITVEGENLKNSSRFGVNKGSSVEVVFQNKDTKSRTLAFSNGVRSEPSSNGKEVVVPAFIVNGTVTFSVPGEKMQGTISVF